MKKILGLAFLFLFISVFTYTQDKEQMINLLYEIDYRRTRGDEIVLIEEFNFGIPGGINWLVGWYGYSSGTRRNYTSLMVYVVDVEGKETKYRDPVLLTSMEYPLYNLYYESFPGITINNGICQIGDYNGDGFCEILRLGPATFGPQLDIQGYDPQTNKIKIFFSKTCALIDEGYGPPPVEFITYKGMKGFKLLYHEGSQVAGGPDWVPDPPSPRNNRWYFYTWNEDRREYVEVEEVNPAYIEETYVNTGEWRNIQPTFPSVLAAPEPEANVEAEIVIDDFDPGLYENSDERNNRQTPSWVWAAIGGGALLIVCVVVIIKRKK